MDIIAYFIGDFWVIKQYKSSSEPFSAELRKRKYENCLITGATRNTGLAIARRFAKEGWNIAITSRDAEVAKIAASKLAEEFFVTPEATGCSLTVWNP